MGRGVAYAVLKAGVAAEGYWPVTTTSPLAGAPTALPLSVAGYAFITDVGRLRRSPSPVTPHPCGVTTAAMSSRFDPDPLGMGLLWALKCLGCGRDREELGSLEDAEVLRRPEGMEVEDRPCACGARFMAVRWFGRSPFTSADEVEALRSSLAS
jgi:hypothetical protein